MEWFRVESVFPESEKVEKLEQFHTRLFEKAITMWVFAGCYCARNSTDGRISERQLARLVPTIKRPKPVIEALISCGLIDHDHDGLTMHDYLDYNPSKTDKEKWRDDNRQRQQDFRDRKRNALRNGVTNGVTNEEVTEGCNAPPVLSGPVRSGREEEPPQPNGLLPLAVWQRWEQEFGGPAGDFTSQLKYCKAVADVVNQFPNPQEVLDSTVTAYFKAKKRPTLRFFAADIGDHLPRTVKPPKQPPTPEQQWRDAEAAKS